MSKRDIKAELESNSIIGGFIAPQETPKKPTISAPLKKEDNTTKKTKTMSEGLKKGLLEGMDIEINGYKYKNGKDKTNNYTITFKIDADIEQYLKHIDTITFIESMSTNEVATTNATDYVNELIRQDLKKRFKIAPNETDSKKWISAYQEYAKKYGLKDKK